MLLICINFNEVLVEIHYQPPEFIELRMENRKMLKGYEAILSINFLHDVIDVVTCVINSIVCRGHSITWFSAESCILLILS